MIIILIETFSFDRYKRLNKYVIFTVFWLWLIHVLGLCIIFLKWVTFWKTPKGVKKSSLKSFKFKYTSVFFLMIQRTVKYVQNYSNCNAVSSSSTTDSHKTSFHLKYNDFLYIVKSNTTLR